MEGQTKQNFIVKNGQNYAKIQHLLLQKENMEIVFKTYYERIQKYVIQDKYLQNLRERENKRIQKWKPQLNQKFALICAALGITQATPRQIQSCLTTIINRQQIKEHLESLKRLLVHEYKLDSIAQLENSHMPTSITNN